MSNPIKIGDHFIFASSWTDPFPYLIRIVDPLPDPNGYVVDEEHRSTFHFWGEVVALTPEYVRLTLDSTHRAFVGYRRICSGAMLYTPTPEWCLRLEFLGMSILEHIKK